MNTSTQTQQIVVSLASGVELPHPEKPIELLSFVNAAKKSLGIISLASKLNSTATDIDKAHAEIIYLAGLNSVQLKAMCTLVLGEWKK